MNNKVLLINTTPGLDYWSVQREPQLGIPLGILSIGTLLSQNNYSVKIIDPLVDKDYMKTIEDNLCGCLFAGLSVMTAGIGCALEVSRFIRSIDRSIPIVWGGVHPTLLPEQTLACGDIDYICWGEGENTCLELSNAFANNEPTSTIEGLGYRIDTGVVVNRREHFLDPDSLPMPNYDLLNINEYLYRDLGTLTNVSSKMKVFVVNTGLGCPYRCLFCYNTHPSQKYRPKSLERVLAEVDDIVSRFNPDVIHIQDDLFFVDKRRVFGFFDEYDKRGYRFGWFTLTRANYFGDDYISNKFLDRIKEHCLWLGLGIESGDATIRKWLNKDVAEYEIWTAVDVLARSNVNAGYAFMVGLPGETKQDMLKTVQMIREIKRRHRSGSFVCQLYRPYPGTELFNKATELGYGVPDSLEQWVSLQDETGYTALGQAVWIEDKDKGFVQYLLNAMEWSQYSAVSIAGGGLANRLKNTLCTILLKYPLSLSLRMRLFFDTWTLFYENCYCSLLHWAYKLWQKERKH